MKEHPAASANTAPLKGAKEEQTRCPQQVSTSFPRNRPRLSVINTKGTAKSAGAGSKSWIKLKVSMGWEARSIQTKDRQSWLQICLGQQT